MSYQALARRWRPRDFDSLVGQNHIVQALVHSLTKQQLHHAYLFTGTRGIGKTTLARILAKALNCEKGITAHPCNSCSACLQLDQSSFIDYVELDAASNRGVEEITVLLDRVMYAPVNARFKVYMIDEVHMLSNHAFNAMLKTLEEPPHFVKFIFATTEPEKIPITILSRCLQFNLRRMREQEIVGYIKKVLSSDSIKFEEKALELIARAAEGSMRDALSLLDQAIAFSDGQVCAQDAREMLGLINEDIAVKLLEAIHSNDNIEILNLSEQILFSNVSFYHALETVARVLHRLAWYQISPSVHLPFVIDQSSLSKLSKLFTAEEIQLFYKISLSAKNELALAPDEFSGFTMAFLRMLAFRPQFEINFNSQVTGQSDSKTSYQNVGETDDLFKERSAHKVDVNLESLSAKDIFSDDGNYVEASSGASTAVKKLLNVVKGGGQAEIELGKKRPCGSSSQNIPLVHQLSRDVAEPKDISAFGKQPISDNDSQSSLSDKEDWLSNWPDFATSIPLKGLSRQLALASEFVSFDQGHLSLMVSSLSFTNETVVKKLEQAINEILDRQIKIFVKVGSVKNTAILRNKKKKDLLFHEAKQSIILDPTLQTIVENFDGEIIDQSIHLKE